MDEKRIHVGVVNLPATLEIGLPAGFHDLKPMLYDTLAGYRLGPYGNGYLGAALGRPDRFEPRLAESWTVSDDGLTWDMRLRDDVRSPSGKLLDAEDVRYTIERGFHVSGYYKWTAEVGGLTDWQDIEAVDKRTVRFRLTSPRSFFLDTRIITLNGIFDSDLVKSRATPEDPWSEQFISKNAAGFGPYSIVDRVEGARMVFRSRPDYYRGAPFFNEVVYHVIPDGEERIARMRSGELDFVQGLSLAQVHGLADCDAVRVLAGPGTSSFELSLRCVRSFFADVHARRAVALAIPYERILTEVFQGTARRWKGNIPEVVEGYLPEIWPYETDPAAARVELEECTMPESVEVLGSAADGLHRPAGELIVAGLVELGLPARLSIVSHGEYVERSIAGRYDALLTGATPQVPDPGYQLFHDYCTTSEGNDFGYSNPELDGIVAEGLNEPDRDTRMALYRKAQEMLAADVPVVPIASLGSAMAFNRRIGNVHWYPSGVPRYSELTPAR